MLNMFVARPARRKSADAMERLREINAHAAWINGQVQAGLARVAMLIDQAAGMDEGGRQQAAGQIDSELQAAVDLANEATGYVLDEVEALASTARSEGNSEAVSFASGVQRFLGEISQYFSSTAGDLESRARQAGIPLDDD